MRESCRAFDKSHANESIVALAEHLAKSFAAYNPAVNFTSRKGRFRLCAAAVLFDSQNRVLLASNAARRTFTCPAAA